MMAAIWYSLGRVHSRCDKIRANVQIYRRAKSDRTNPSPIDHTRERSKGVTGVVVCVRIQVVVWNVQSSALLG
jgi:hypothetical protein